MLCAGMGCAQLLMCLWLLRGQDPTTSQSNAPKVLKDAAGLCIAPCGFCRMQLLVASISVECSEHPVKFLSHGGHGLILCPWNFTHTR